MSQKEEILQYMIDHGSITSMQAFMLGITRLSAWIWDLRNDGHKIRSTRIDYKAKDGKRKHYDVYALEDNT